MGHQGSSKMEQDVTIQFRPDFAVIVCDHVFSGASPVLLVVRDEETSWQFLCGSDVDADDCHSVGVGHLIAHDASLSQMAALPAGFCAERESASMSWSITSLDA